jgi:hypothetical protein
MIVKRDKLIAFFVLSFLLIFIRVVQAKEISEVESKSRLVFTSLLNFNNFKKIDAPRLIFFRKKVNSRCGELTVISYCKYDDTIYGELDQLLVFSKITPIAIDVIIAHEFAHAMQNRYDFGSKYTVVNELQADCLSGVYLSDKYANSLDDVYAMLSLLWSSGDFNVYSEFHHGFPNQRLQAIVIGLGMAIKSKSNGVTKCITTF